MEFTFQTLDALSDIPVNIADHYNELIYQLKGEKSHVAVLDLEEVKERANSELLLFVFSPDGTIAGMAQASFHCTPAHYTAQINNVVVDEAYRGHGLGSLLMSELEKRSKERWNKLQGFRLTSSPRRGTQGFYTRLGYRMRTKEAGDETTVYVKEV